MIRSLSYDQKEVIQNIMLLRGINSFDADITYGNGVFWKGLPEPKLAFDIDPQKHGVIAASSTQLPLADTSLDSIAFDPPFLTYVRSRAGNGNMVMSRRFAGYWAYDQLREHYVDTLVEARRVLKPGGTLMFKCQDIIHNHKMHCTHANVLEWAHGFRLADLFILGAKSRMPAPNRAGTQKHARIWHSYFMVLERLP